MIFDLNTHYSGLPEHCINIITSAEQDPNAGNSRVAVCRSQKVPKHDFEHFRTSGEHADSTNRLARYDFLLVFYSDLKSMWNQWNRLISRQRQQIAIPNNWGEQHHDSRSILSAALANCDVVKKSKCNKLTSIADTLQSAEVIQQTDTICKFAFEVTFPNFNHFAGQLQETKVNSDPFSLRF